MNSKNDLVETHIEVLRAIDIQVELTQRQLTEELDACQGKADYWIKALIDKGLVRIGNFSHGQKKLGYRNIRIKTSAKKEMRLPELLLGIAKNLKLLILGYY